MEKHWKNLPVMMARAARGTIAKSISDAATKAFAVDLFRVVSNGLDGHPCDSANLVR